MGENLHQVSDGDFRTRNSEIGSSRSGRFLGFVVRSHVGQSVR